MSQVELSERINVARNTLNRYEGGVREAPEEVIRLWAEVTGVSFEWLWSGEKPQQVSTVQEAHIRWTPEGLRVDY